MSLTAQSLKEIIDERLQVAHSEVIDTSGGCGQSFDVVIVSPLFGGKGLLQRHRLVNDALKEEISQIHAFSQKVYTPEQWKTMNQQA